ncbi:hypothetical protein PG993_004567 [Apiospora rasikravindrae]|uniref:Rhodopsin domain-containing protein n=1 Tax=Apiospora rasikravindrae TaxID=990691 RepID=A0ABR1TD72_9PEZI
MSSVTYTFAIMTAKASIAALHLTVFRGRSCLLQTLNQGLLLFLVCEAIEEIAVVTSQCVPTIGAWSSTGPGACVNLKPFWWTTHSAIIMTQFINFTVEFVQFACYIATNILLFFQPLPFLWYKGLPPYDLATLVGIVIVGILCASTFRFCHDYAMPYIWSEIDVCVILLFSCGLSAREILHSSKTAHQPPTTAPAPAGLALKWPSWLTHLRLPGRVESRPQSNTPMTTSPSDAFRERIAWLELLNTHAHSPYVLPGSHRQLGTQIRIEAAPPPAAEEGDAVEGSLV